ncbi:MAG: 16S rRNA (guanine(966)-N(2))-methyltransferase RsmD [Tissierellia bacterium]|nr:16S rRNA (guanine(966)-N(2))-methyltransferase RsmD [Tissierellia bacterium]
MRVISGDKKGFKLKAPKGKDTRPTEDRVKESLFNILGDIDNNSMVLDLFAGSGSIGIEFLSRGAKMAYFIDNSSLSIKTIKENLIHTNFLKKSKIIKGDSIKSIKFLGREDIKFDYIYIDPPYGGNLIEKSMKSILKANILNNNAILILEHKKALDLPNILYGLEKTDIRNYGNKVLTFYTYNKEA